MPRSIIMSFAERAVIERRLAQNAPLPEIAAAHEKLAGLYEKLVERLADTGEYQNTEPRQKKIK